MNTKENIQTIRPIDMRTTEEAIKAPIITEVAAATADLMAVHWNRIKDICDGNDGGKIGIGYTIEIDLSGVQTKVVTKIRYAQKYDDEREALLEDPRQERLEL